MRFFLWISSGVAIVRATALENLFDDWDSSSNAALLTSVDETPIDMSTSSDFLPQYSSGEEPLNSSDFDSLASNSLPPEGIDSVFMADKPDSCSTSIDSKRLRRDGGPVCGTQDPSTQDPSTDQVPTSNWDSSPADTPFPMTNYDRRSCQPERYSYLVCSSSDQSTIENAAAFLILGLYDCTRVYNARDMAQCVAPSKLFCCRSYNEYSVWYWENDVRVSRIRTVATLCMPLDWMTLP